MDFKQLSKITFLFSFLIMIFLPILVYPQKKTKKDIIIASQLSQEQLQTMGTNELLLKCLEYPYLADAMFAQNVPLIFKYIRQEFNGFEEFFKRQDAPQILLNNYLNFDFDKIKDFQENYEKGLYVFRFCYLNLMLSQESIISKLNTPYEIINQICQKYSVTNKSSLSPFRSSITYSFVGYNILRYLENTELGQSAEFTPLIASIQSMNISFLDYEQFDNIIQYVSINLGGMQNE